MSLHGCAQPRNTRKTCGKFVLCEVWMPRGHPDGELVRVRLTDMLVSPYSRVLSRSIRGNPYMSVRADEIQYIAQAAKLADRRSLNKSSQCAAGPGQ